MVYPRYSQLFPDLKAVRDSLERSYIEAQPAIELAATTLYQSDKQAALSMLNTYSNKQAQQMLARWKHLATYLIVKHNDMAVKPEQDGRFLRTKEGMGASVQRPGFPKPFARKLATETGSRYECPAE